jgi:cellulose synthase/poly-beta-1,6-N-acetylglucosamine synthase-like glycosyltransferase
MNPDWLATIVSFREKTKASLIIGPVAYLYNNSFFAKMQALEFASLIASGAASAYLHRPIMCNGANLAFLKSEYPMDENSLASDSPSGDDIFLLQFLKKKNRKAIKFLKPPESIVYTNPSDSLPEFINQRKRWYSKSSLYTDFEMLGAGFIIAFANFSLILAFTICLTSSVSWTFLLWLFIAKLSSDMIFLYPFLGFIKSKKLLWLAPVLEILYPFYIFYIMLSSRIGRYNWKDRKY